MPGSSLMSDPFSLVSSQFLLLSMGVGGLVGVLGAALALGIRHGIDWDHIAAITDITSTAASLEEPESGWLVREPALLLEVLRSRLFAGGVGPRGAAPQVDRFRGGERIRSWMRRQTGDYRRRRVGIRIGNRDG